MFAGKPVQRTIVVGTLFCTNSAKTVLEFGITFELRSMVATTAGTNSGVIHGLNDFLGTKFPDSTALDERVVICFKTLDGAERAGSLDSVLVVLGMRVRISVLILKNFLPFFLIHLFFLKS